MHADPGPQRAVKKMKVIKWANIVWMSPMPSQLSVGGNATETQLLIQTTIDFSKKLKKICTNVSRKDEKTIWNVTSGAKWSLGMQWDHI